MSENGPITSTQETVIQVSGFPVEYTDVNQSYYFLVAVTNVGRVIMSRGDGDWADVTGNAKARGEQS